MSENYGDSNRIYSKVFFGLFLRRRFLRLARVSVPVTETPTVSLRQGFYLRSGSAAAMGDRLGDTYA
jgi:hypothetical protein